MIFDISVSENGGEKRMAWISIHEQIMGGKLRELSKYIGCSQNEAIGILTRLWLWGINNADKKGIIIGADKEDIAEVLAVGRNKDIEAVNIVEALIESRWIDEENDYLILHDWEEWQEPLYTFKERRERDAARKRQQRAIQREEEESKYKTENNLQLLERLMSEYEIDDYLSDKLRTWFKYKVERKEPYREQGMKSLLTQISKKVKIHGDEAVIELIDECMASNWKGIIWERLEGKNQKKKNTFNQFPQNDYNFEEIEKNLGN